MDEEGLPNLEPQPAPAPTNAGETSSGRYSWQIFGQTFTIYWYFYLRSGSNETGSGRLSLSDSEAKATSSVAKAKQHDNHPSSEKEVSTIGQWSFFCLSFAWRYAEF